MARTFSALPGHRATWVLAEPDEATRATLQTAGLSVPVIREPTRAALFAARDVQGSSVSGDLIDACTGAAVAARITIAGKSTCSVSGKGCWQLTGLPPGGPQTLAAGRAGYQAFSASLTLVSGFNALEKISLTPAGGCSVPPPADGVSPKTQSPWRGITAWSVRSRSPWVSFSRAPPAAAERVFPWAAVWSSATLASASLRESFEKSGALRPSSS